MGALGGIRILELAGIGPAPFCGMMLADHGAEVIRIERPGGGGLARDPLARGRIPLTVDLKRAEGVALVRALARASDGLIEGFRPGVMERLGLGPETLLQDHPKLVYGRMTGFGQTGPLAARAGHDIDYLALSGTLHTIGRAGERPVMPANYLGDFGGGGMLLAFGMVAALLAVRLGAPGQVIDAAMTDGSALLATLIHGLRAQGLWRDQRGVNLLDGGAPFYDVYVCADGKFIAVGALEPEFFAVLVAELGVAGEPAFAAQMDPALWPAMRARLTEIFASAPRDAWAARFAGKDACVAPVLSLAEAPSHSHNAARETFRAGMPAAAPRFSATPASVRRIVPDDILTEIGYDRATLDALRQARVLG